jgi:hypothetical protein
MGEHDPLKCWYLYGVISQETQIFSQRRQNLEAHATIILKEVSTITAVCMKGGLLRCEAV